MHGMVGLEDVKPVPESYSGDHFWLEGKDHTRIGFSVRGLVHSSQKSLEGPDRSDTPLAGSASKNLHRSLQSYVMQLHSSPLSYIILKAHPLVLPTDWIASETRDHRSWPRPIYWFSRHMGGCPATRHYFFMPCVPFWPGSSRS